MGLEYHVCYNGGAHESKCKQYRFPHRHYVPPPPIAGGNLKKKEIHFVSDTTAGTCLGRIWLAGKTGVDPKKGVGGGGGGRGPGCMNCPSERG